MPESENKTMDALLAKLAETMEERDRYRDALVYIADRESGLWGVEARKVLYPKPKAPDA